MKMHRKNGFFEELYSDVCMLGDGYRKIFKRLFSFLHGVLTLFILRITSVPFSFIVYLISCVWDVCKALYYEGKKFTAEVKRALPTIKSKFKESPSHGVYIFLRYIGRTFRVHEKFTRAFLSTVIPIFAVICLFGLYSSLSAVTFALDVTVNGECVGTVSDESAYKEAETLALKRFSQLGSELDISVPEYTVTLALAGNIDDTETVCNNLIAAVSDNTVKACGVYVDGEFLCAVKSEDTFNRVVNKILSEYASENGYDSSDCTVEFANSIETVSGLFPDNDKIWSAEELTAYFDGWESEHIEHTVTENDNVADILKKYNISKDELLALNENLDLDNIPVGSTLLISQGKRNVSIKATVTYTNVETSDYDTVIQYDNNFYVGTTMTIVPGEPGRDVVSYTDTYLDSVLVSSSGELARYNANDPVNELIKVGTLGVPVGDDDSPISPRLLRDQGGAFIWPAPDNCFWLSQAYNPSKGHYGIDIVSSDNGSCKGRKIVSVADGVVVLATYHYSWGYYIRVDHGDGVVTGYAHALEGSFRVNVGDYVKAGQQLSSIGTTGNSTGYHLHFEVWLDGTRVNPLPYVYSEYSGIAVIS